MYWNPFDSAHSGRINASDGWSGSNSQITSGRSLVGCGIIFETDSQLVSRFGIRTEILFTSSARRQPSTNVLEYILTLVLEVSQSEPPRHAPREVKCACTHAHFVHAHAHFTLTTSNKNQSRHAHFSHDMHILTCTFH